MTAAVPSARRAPLLRAATAALATAAAVVAGTGASGCSYSPRPQNGALACGPSGECPDGYQCLTSTGPTIPRCWDINTLRNLDGGNPADGGNLPPTDAALPDGDPTPVDRPPQADRRSDTGVLDTGGTVPARDRYVGKWVFGANATEVIDCGPTFMLSQTSITNTSMELLAGDASGGTADLTAMDICDIYLRLDPAGTYLIGADQAGCIFEETTAAGKRYRYTYSAYEFSFFTANGQTGTLLLADYDVLWEELDASDAVVGAVICRQTVSNASMSKLPAAAR